MQYNVQKNAEGKVEVYQVKSTKKRTLLNKRKLKAEHKRNHETIKALQVRNAQLVELVAIVDKKTKKYEKQAKKNKRQK